MPTPARVVVSPQTVQAYQRTRYHVALEGAPFALRIGERSPEIGDLHRSAGAVSSAFVTASNPFGQRCDDEANARAMERLRARLDAGGVRWIAGEGRGDDATWPAEASVLAVGISPDDALALCVEFEQNAVVVIGPDAIPRLLFHPRAVVAPSGDRR